MRNKRENRKNTDCFPSNPSEASKDSTHRFERENRKKPRGCFQMPKKSEEKNKEQNKVSGEFNDSEKETIKTKKLSQLEFEKKVRELSEKGLTSEKIGEELRKQGIHPKHYAKKISKILREKYINPDLKNIEAKLERIQKHYEKNKQDKRAMREKDRVFSQLRNLQKYFKVPAR